MLTLDWTPKAFFVGRPSRHAKNVRRLLIILVKTRTLYRWNIKKVITILIKTGLITSCSCKLAKTATREVLSLLFI